MRPPSVRRWPGRRGGHRALRHLRRGACAQGSDPASWSISRPSGTPKTGCSPRRLDAARKADGAGSRFRLGARGPRRGSCPSPGVLAGSGRHRPRRRSRALRSRRAWPTMPRCCSPSASRARRWRWSSARSSLDPLSAEALALKARCLLALGRIADGLAATRAAVVGEPGRSGRRWRSWATRSCSAGRRR